MEPTIPVKVAAAKLGICEDTLYTMVKCKEIPCVRLRRRILFRESSLEAWMKEQENVAISS